jgi:DNA (cytosine-5)-methyltransferase 1
MEQAGFEVSWSNDLSPKKHRMFEANFGDHPSEHVFELGDLQSVDASTMPSPFDVAWASFPCTDLSVAGGRAGLNKGSSSAFWLFVKNLASMKEARPPVIALENVTGFVSSRAGRDISSAIRALNGLGYSVDVINLDARRFVPQSRPRLFLVGVRGAVKDDARDSPLRPNWLDALFDDPGLRTHRAALPTPPDLLSSGLTELVEKLPDEDARWWNDDAIAKFRSSLSDLQQQRLSELIRSPTPVARSAFRRMRHGVPRWEIRSDDIAGCLRTARGGSSRQALVYVSEGRVRVRWMTPMEYARLMGAGDYRLEGVPPYDAYSAFGDAVCVPVVTWLSNYYLRPLLENRVDQSSNNIDLTRVDSVA